MCTSTISDYGVKICNNKECKINKPFNVLEKHGLATIRNGWKQVYNPGDPIMYSILKEEHVPNNCTMDVIDRFNVFIDSLIEWYKLYWKWEDLYKSIGHYGYAIEILDAGSGNGSANLACPHCGSRDITLSTFRPTPQSKEAEPLEDKVSVMRRHPITKEWYKEEVDVSPNPDCDYDFAHLDMRERSSQEWKDLDNEAKDDGIYDYQYFIPVKPNNIFKDFRFNKRYKKIR